MKIIIIEDEELTADDLADTIVERHPEARIEAVLHSVRESVAYLEAHRDADLIFSDIQLGDGLSFDIFSRVDLKIPVIFCTAFDEYALNAFKANGIDYILKPFTLDSVSAAIRKYLSFTSGKGGAAIDYGSLEKLFAVRRDAEPGSVLVYYQDQILPVPLGQIAFFYLRNGLVTLTTFENKTFSLNKSLDEVGKVAEPLFFRTNRQFLVNRKAVVKASSHLARKLSVHLSVQAPESVTVSREKITQFLDWLASS
ncbi:LytR/AlgR family response regulator transcription factor [Dinghuibacter silviterrae]|uniref:LytTR family two component transcriptional regulator n=1 Tax=Dinghuibacter silviterrae TaxID=1539049 RepID=A0A4R8DFK0_9BACT|nr:LytTR family DNA-binding domain-containing protein [Dinghuibacter silviterrae]TDW96383.1 LytTR family two component transcriptional regulator [Dinghuibacter silviterrae]